MRAARKPAKPPVGPLHSLTNLRTPARLRPGEGAPADDLSKFTIPKLKLPAAQSARKTAQQPSGEGATTAVPQSAGPRQPSSGGAGPEPQQQLSTCSELSTDAGRRKAEAPRSTGSAVPTGAADTSAALSHSAATKREAGASRAEAAVAGDAMQDAPLAAQPAGNSEAGISRAPARGAQGGGTRHRRSHAVTRTAAPAAPDAPAAPVAPPQQSAAAADASEDRQAAQVSGNLQPATGAASAAAQEAQLQPDALDDEPADGTEERAAADSPPESIKPPSPPPEPLALTPVQQAPPTTREPAAVQDTPAPAADTPAASRYVDASDDEGAAPGSPGYCPTGERRSGSQDPVCDASAHAC